MGDLVGKVEWRKRKLYITQETISKINEKEWKYVKNEGGKKEELQKTEERVEKS
jgi:hypothetical protein